MNRRGLAFRLKALCLHGIGLRFMKDGCRPGPAMAMDNPPLPGLWVYFLALRSGTKGQDIYPVFALSHLAPERAPSLIGEDVLAGLDFGLRDALGRKARDDGGPIGERQAADGA